MSKIIRQPTGNHYRGRFQPRLPLGQGYGRFPLYQNQMAYRGRPVFNTQNRHQSTGHNTTGNYNKKQPRDHTDKNGEPTTKKSKTLESRIKMKGEIEAPIVKNYNLDPSPGSAHIINAINAILPM